MNDIAIKLENISKQYRLGVVGTGTLSHDLNRWWAKIRGKEDPFFKIGQENKLSKSGGDFVWALKDINLEIKQGEVIGIIGKNGAGKSTLLKVLSQVTGPSTGQIKVKGRIASLLEVGTGFHPELTGKENIFLNGAILGMTKNDIRKKLDEIVDFAGVAKYLNTPVKRYSSGMYVRLAFAVAAHLEPDILIVDEVLAVGDAEFQRKAIGKMQDVSKEGGRTVLFVSHNMSSIKRLCTSAVLLQNGQIVEIGTTSFVIDKYLSNNPDSYVTESSPKNENKDIEVLNVKLVNENGDVISGLYDVHKPFYIDYTIRLNVDVKRSAMMIYFKNSKDEYVFLSDRNDYKTNIIPKEKGIYNIRIKINQPIMKPDRYFLTLGITNKDNLQTNHFDSILNFELKDFTGVRPERVGYIYQPLLWETKKNN